MYGSVKPWIDVPFAILPFAGRSATGDKLYKDPIPSMCYPRGKVLIVRNWQGVEVVSNTHLYVEGFTEITELDSVEFEGKVRPVQAVECFYRKGKPDIKVVYI